MSQMAEPQATQLMSVDTLARLEACVLDPDALVKAGYLNQQLDVEELRLRVRCDNCGKSESVRYQDS